MAQVRISTGAALKAQLEKIENGIEVRGRHNSGSYGDYNGPIAKNYGVEVDDSGTLAIEAYVGGPDKGDVVQLRFSPSSVSRMASLSFERLQYSLERLQEAYQNSLGETVLRMKNDNMSVYDIHKKIGVEYGDVYDVYHRSD